MLSVFLDPVVRYALANKNKSQINEIKMKPRLDIYKHTAYYTVNSFSTWSNIVLYYTQFFWSSIINWASIYSWILQTSFYTSQACGISCPVITIRINAWPISGSEGQSSAHFKKSENLHNKGAGPSSFWESIYPPRWAANKPYRNNSTPR